MYESLGDSADRESWLILRRGGIGASEMAAVMGLSKYESALAVYARKTGCESVDDAEQSEAAYWGTALETLVAQRFTMKTGIAHDWHGKLLCSTTHAWCLATLDAMCVDGVILECKTASQYLLGDWSEGTPLAYKIQTHQQMLVTGTDRCRVACLVGGQKFMWDEVERDEDLIRRIAYAGSEFWKRVEQLDPPEPDGSDSSRRALELLHPDRDASTMNLPGELIDLDSQRQELKARIKQSEADVDIIDNRIIAALGNASSGALGNGVFYSLKRIKRAGYTVAEKTFTQLTRKAKK